MSGGETRQTESSDARQERGQPRHAYGQRDQERDAAQYDDGHRGGRGEEGSCPLADLAQTRQCPARPRKDEGNEKQSNNKTDKMAHRCTPLHAEQAHSDIRQQLDTQPHRVT